MLASQTEKGIELSDLIQETLPEILGNRGFDVSIHVIFDGQQYDMMKSMMENDIVLFDASLESEDGFPLGANYAAATANIISNDNILVVSRTVLPLNFIPCRTNIPEIGKEEIMEDGRLKQAYTNTEILSWLEQELYRMTEQKRLPRPQELLMQIPPLKKIKKSNGSKIVSKAIEVTKENVNFLSTLKKPQCSFISYRSYYYTHPCNGWDVKRLDAYIRGIHAEESWETLYYPGGILSQEFMPEIRRWGFFSFVDRKMRECSEFWIFNTPQDDGFSYWDSWWTQGEIISLMYQKFHGNKLPDIYVFNPLTGSHEKKDASFLPDLSDDMAKELARFYANSDFISGGIESLSVMRKIRLMPLFLRKFYGMLTRHFMKGTMKDFEVEDALSSKNYEESLRSHTYDDSFVEKRIIACPGCQRTGLSLKDIGTKEFIWKYMHINSNNEEEETEINSRGFFSITESQMCQIIQNKEWRCHYCKKIFRIKKEESYKLYLWWSVRCGRYTGPNNCIVEDVPIYTIKEISEVYKNL